MMFEKFWAASTFILAISISVMLFIVTFSLLQMWGEQVQSEYNRLTAPVTKEKE